MKKLIKKGIKHVVVNTAYHSGLAKLFGSFHGQKVFCVGYHSIRDDKNEEKLDTSLYHNISVKKKDFEDQLVFMKKNGHTFLTFKDLERKDLEKIKKPTIIFFDDGFKDVLLNALPVLKKHKIPATLFVTVGLLDRTHILWTIKLRYLLKKAGLNHKHIEEHIMKLKGLDREKRNSEIEKIETKYKVKLDSHYLDIFLNWQEVLQLKKDVFEIGSHGIQHEKFSELDPADLHKEINDSKSIIEGKIGKIVAISYPYGRTNEKIKNMSKQAGYSYGLGTGHGYNKLHDILTGPFDLKRITPGPGDSLSRFAVELYMNI